MIVRAIDSNNDWMFGKGKNDYLSKNAAIGQCIKTRCQSFLGDCFFSISSGIDWFNYLGAKDLLGLELAIAATILNTQGVTSLVQLSVNLDHVTRKFSASYKVTTVYDVIAGAFVQELEPKQYLLTEDGDFLTTEDGNRIIT